MKCILIFFILYNIVISENKYRITQYLLLWILTKTKHWKNVNYSNKQVKLHIPLKCNYFLLCPIYTQLLTQIRNSPLDVIHQNPNVRLGPAMHNKLVDPPQSNIVADVVVLAHTCHPVILHSIVYYDCWSNMFDTLTNTHLCTPTNWIRYVYFASSWTWLFGTQICSDLRVSACVWFV